VNGMDRRPTVGLHHIVTNNDIRDTSQRFVYSDRVHQRWQCCS